MIIKSIVNHKGGVGKTTTTLNLGKALSMEGFRVLIVDFDPQANLSESLGIINPEKSIKDTLMEGTPLPIINPSENFSLVPSELQLASAESKLKGQELQGYLALKEALEPIKNNYDYILIDCPPSLGVLTSNAFMASNEVMIVLSSQFLPTRGLNTTVEAITYAKKFNKDIKVGGILITQFEQTVIQKSIVEQLRDKYKDLVYETMIRKNVAVQESSALRQDIFTYDPTCAAAKDYSLLSKEIISKEKVHG